LQRGYTKTLIKDYPNVERGWEGKKEGGDDVEGVLDGYSSYI